MNSQTNITKNTIKNQINQEIFLQKILGNNYKWWFIIRYSLISETGGKIGFIFGYISAIARVVSSNYVWFLAGSGTEVFTYLLVGRIYSQISNNLYYYQLSYLIHTGNLISKLMYSTNFFLTQYLSAIGKRLFKNLIQLGGVSIGIIFCLATFAQISSPSWTLFWVILIIPISFTLNHFFGIIFGSLAFWTKQWDYDGIKESYEISFMLLTGSIIPLDKLPFSGIFQFLPTSFWLHHPMQIYLGKYSTIQILYVFLGGIFWSVSLYFLAKFVFQMGFKLNESVGL
jgi:ABC-type uncharacterized transport system permease subunit